MSQSAPDPSAPANSEPRAVVIVGAGPVGLRFAAAAPAPVLYLGRRIVGIEAAQHRGIDHHGDAYPYATLVLATGSHSRAPGMPGIDLRRVCT